jgi:starch synthase (maltosyl-transferring)
LLSEAFTTPRRMEHLAKIGYSHSYTYFAWRNTKAELMAYVEELTQTGLADYFRPSFWPNTPDILTEFLQNGGRAAFINRFVLASTLSSVYGIYGPAFELMENVPREHGSEEYLDSEKYQLRQRDLDHADSLRPIIASMNAIRRENPALHDNRTIRFHSVQLDGRESDHLIAYTKSTAAGPVSPTGRAIYKYEDYAPPPPGSDHNLILTVVNMDPARAHTGWIELPLRELGILPDRPFTAHDLLSSGTTSWGEQDVTIGLEIEIDGDSATGTGRFEAGDFRRTYDVKGTRRPKDSRKGARAIESSHQEVR